MKKLISMLILALAKISTIGVSSSSLGVTTVPGSICCKLLNAPTWFSCDQISDTRISLPAWVLQSLTKLRWLQPAKEYMTLSSYIEASLRTQLSCAFSFDPPTFDNLGFLCALKVSLVDTPSSCIVCRTSQIASTDMNVDLRFVESDPLKRLAGATLTISWISSLIIWPRTISSSLAAENLISPRVSCNKYFPMGLSSCQVLRRTAFRVRCARSANCTKSFRRTTLSSSPTLWAIKGKVSNPVECIELHCVNHACRTTLCNPPSDRIKPDTTPPLSTLTCGKTLSSEMTKSPSKFATVRSQIEATQSLTKLTRRPILPVCTYVKKKVRMATVLHTESARYPCGDLGLRKWKMNDSELSLVQSPDSFVAL